MSKQQSVWHQKQRTTLWRHANFSAEQIHQVAERLIEAGYEDIGREFLTLANSATFFVEELEQEYARRGHVFRRPDGN